MKTRRLRILAILVVAAVLLVGLCVWLTGRDKAPEHDDSAKEALGLMTSLPIYWGEGAGLDDMLSTDQSAHWVRTALEDTFLLVPLDILAEGEAAEPAQELSQLTRLILAQPRTLPAADFVALDSWVRNGGMVLIFADPLLTEHSDLAFGDKRRPQDVALLSPILARWGLGQYFDEDQSDAARLVMFEDTSIPIRKAGRFEVIAGGAATCRLFAQNVIAECTIGEGRAIIVSDAAMLEREGDFETAGKALDSLIRFTFRSR